jgi:thiosulfate reductase cytochrome b subunit
MNDTAPSRPATPTRSRRRVLVYRHSRITRLTHWINVLCISILVMSGLQIFNAHPALYWGQYGFEPDKAFLEIGGSDESDSDEPIGYARLGSWTIPTTGVLGVSDNAEGEPVFRGFPQWATLPGWRDLALGRRWHFFFAWIFVLNMLVYFIAGLASGHLRRDLLPSLRQLHPAALFHDLADHLRLRFPKGEAARHYNVLQKLAYLGVVCVLLPAMILTGLTMSPGMDAVLPWLVDLFGGRQSARSVHFIAATLILLFVLIHLAMVLLAEVRNELRSMITGRFAISAEDHHEQA